MFKSNFDKKVEEVKRQKEFEKQELELKNSIKKFEQQMQNATEMGIKARREGDKKSEASADRLYTCAKQYKQICQDKLVNLMEQKGFVEIVKIQKTADGATGQLPAAGINKKGINKMRKRANRSAKQLDMMKEYQNEMETLNRAVYDDMSSSEISSEFASLIDKELAKEQDDIDLVEDLFGKNKNSTEN